VIKINRTDEIVEIVTDVRNKYKDQLTAYATEITDTMNDWFDKENTPMDLRHALLCYAHACGDDLGLEFAFQLAMQDYDSDNDEQ